MSHAIAENSPALSATEQLVELISALAHELRNPLTGISINVQYLQMAYAQTEAQQQIYADLMESVSRLDQMMRDFLEFVQPVRLSLESVDLNRLVKEILSQQNSLIRHHKVQISHSWETPLPEVEVDVERFRRALGAIVEHCLSTLDGKGQLTIRSQQDLTGLVLEIAHNGRSLGLPRLQQLFDPLTAWKAPETGFGLAFARKILEAHHCQITIDSQQGGWTRWLVTFPLHVQTIP